MAIMFAGAGFADPAAMLNKRAKAQERQCCCAARRQGPHQKTNNKDSTRIERAPQLAGAPACALAWQMNLSELDKSSSDPEHKNPQQIMAMDLCHRLPMNDLPVKRRIHRRASLLSGQHGCQCRELVGANGTSSRDTFGLGNSTLAAALQASQRHLSRPLWATGWPGRPAEKCFLERPRRCNKVRRRAVPGGGRSTHHHKA